MWQAIAGSIAAPILGRLLGEALAKGDQKRADALYQQAVDQYGQQAADELAQVSFQSLGKSQMGAVQGDAQMDSYAREALRRIAQDAATPGLTAEEKMAQAEAQAEAARYEAGQRGAIEQNAQARGIGGSGFELASRLSAEQGGAERANRAAMAASANAEARRRLAQEQLLHGAAGYQGQLFGQSADKARADDAFRRFDAEMANQQAQWRYGQQAALRDKQAGAFAAQGGRYDDKADRTRETWTEAGSGVSSGIGAAGANADYAAWLKSKEKK